MCIREAIPSRLLQCKSQCNIENLSVQINLKKRKWFLNCSYNPQRISISSHLEYLNHVIDEHDKTYDNFFFIGDFNEGTDGNSMKKFCDINCLKSLIKDQHVSKNLILTNLPNRFQHSITFETAPSGLSLLALTVFKMEFQKLKPKLIVSRGCKNFGNAKFRYDIFTATSNAYDFGMYKKQYF